MPLPPTPPIPIRPGPLARFRELTIGLPEYLAVHPLADALHTDRMAGLTLCWLPVETICVGV